jgi:hypothetical protein
MTISTELVAGRMYDVRTHSQEGNNRWVYRKMTALYLGPAGAIDEWAEEFSGRPLFDTCRIAKDSIIGATEVPSTTPPSRPVSYQPTMTAGELLAGEGARG